MTQTAVTDLFFLKRLLDLLQIGQEADISADLVEDRGERNSVCCWIVPVVTARWQQKSRKTNLVNGGSQTGQSRQAVHVNLAAVRLSGHEVGSGI